MNNKSYKWFVSTFFALHVFSFPHLVNAANGDPGNYPQGNSQHGHSESHGGMQPGSPQGRGSQTPTMYPSNAGAQHGHGSQGRNIYPEQAGHEINNQHGHAGPQNSYPGQRGNMHGHGRPGPRGHYYNNGRYYNYHHNGAYYNYYHDGEYYNYYNKGKYYRYLVNGAYYNYLYRGGYYVYYVNGRYYNYFYNGAYYNDCRKNRGYWSRGVWHPAVMVCR